MELSDIAEIRDCLEIACGAPLRLHENRQRSPAERLTHSRVDVGPLAIDDIHFPGDVEASPDPLGRVVVLWLTGGRVEVQCDGIRRKASAGEVTLVSQPDLPHYVRAQDVTVTAVSLDPSVAAGVASGVPIGQAPVPIRFDGFGPVNAASAQLWMRTVSYVKNSVLAHDQMTTPLVVGQVCRLLAAVTLSTFPARTAAPYSRHDRTDAKPVLLRRAVAYIERNVDNDIALADVAEAVHVTPRAVQYMFRKHMGTTPLQHLRRVRLDRAHQDLLRADRVDDTVTAIAARWGFMHSGRFALLYRQTYGESPHKTMRG